MTKGSHLIRNAGRNRTPTTDPIVAVPTNPPLRVARVLEELRSIPAKGLDHNRQPRKRVIVLGAGLAGLVAAHELKRQGHTPIVLEARNRVGGRVWTLRDPYFSSDVYAEAGAMRLPAVHELSLSYCKEFDLELRPFVTGNENSLVCIGGERFTFAEANEYPDRLPFALSDRERGRNFQSLWDEATQPITEILREEGEAGFSKIVKEYDQYSLRDFLRLRGMSDGAIEYLGVMTFRESNMSSAVVESLRQSLGKAYEDMREVVGGMDRLPNAFYENLKEEIRFGHKVQSIEQTGDSVTVRGRTGAQYFSVSGDYAICTIPFGVLRTIDAFPEFSRGKQQAMRELGHNHSTKILFQVRHRFWEAEDGIIGGTTTTDLPIRRIVYPSFSDPNTTRGVLLASYTWGQDAARWGAISEEERIQLALEDMAKIHPRVLREFEVGASYAWYNDPYARGAYAHFEPTQMTRLHPHVIAPEGRVYFAGEHCSFWHAWIEGALESGIRAAREVHQESSNMA